MPVSLSIVVAKDGAGNTIAGGLQAQDKSGGGTGPFTLGHVLIDGAAGTNMATVNASGQLLVAANAGTNLNTSALALESGGNLATIATNTGAPIAAGTAVIGKVGIDQTSAGSTNAVSLAFIGSTAAAVGNGVVGNGVQRVAIASDNTPFPNYLVPFTSGGLTRSRTLIPNNTTAIVVKASAGQLYKIRATNNSSTIAYIKLYDATSATAGSGTPVDTIMIPAATAGGAGVIDTTDIGAAHATGITYIVTTGIADNDTTAPAANAYIVTMLYK